MERLLLAAVGTIFIATTATPPVLANKTAANSNITQNITQKQIKENITPFNLVSLAYQGEFKTQGVGGYNSLITAILFDEVSGKDLVQIGIDTGRLSANTINDSSYISSVNSQLKKLPKN